QVTAARLRPRDRAFFRCVARSQTLTFLLDTNVVSEWTKPRPDPQVVAWLAAADEDRLLLSVITLAELRNGVASLPPGRKREQLDTWLSYELRDRFAGRLLPIDAAIADQWGSI